MPFGAVRPLPHGALPATLASSTSWTTPSSQAEFQALSCTFRGHGCWERRQRRGKRQGPSSRAAPGVFEATAKNGEVELGQLVRLREAPGSAAVPPASASPTRLFWSLRRVAPLFGAGVPSSPCPAAPWNVGKGAVAGILQLLQRLRRPF